MPIRVRVVLIALLLGLSCGVLADLPLPNVPGGNTQTLYVIRVNTQDRRIFVYRLSDPVRGGGLVLNSLRDYAVDLVPEELDSTKMKSTSTETIKRTIEASSADFQKARADHEKAFKGQKYDVDDWLGDQNLASPPLKPSDQTTLITPSDMVRTGPGFLHGSITNSGFFYLLDEANKKLLAYQITDAKLLILTAVRKLEWDERLKFPDSKDHAPMSVEEIKALVLSQEKRKAGK